MNTKDRTLSFSVNNVDYGVAVNDFPLNIQFVPVIIINCQGTSVELLE